MEKLKYSLFALLFLLCGCGSGSTSAPAPSEVSTEARDNNHENRKRIYERYINIRDGRRALGLDAQAKLLQEFERELARHQTIAVEKKYVNCKRFVDLYGRLGLQIVDLYEYTLLHQISYLERQTMLPKAYILESILGAFLSLAKENSEGGIGVKCFDRQREVWLFSLEEVADRLRDMRIGFFGEPNIDEELYIMSQLQQDLTQTENNRLERVAFLGAETLAVIVSWLKLVRPLLSALNATPSSTLVKFFGHAVITSGFLSAVFAADKYMRRHVNFLQTLPSLTPAGHEWNSFIDFAEDAGQTVISAPLYFGFLQTVRLTKREDDLKYLKEHEDVLREAERQFGTVDEALDRMDSPTRE